MNHRRTGCLIVIIATIVLWSAIIYIITSL